jgi:hypothetical protein
MSEVPDEVQAAMSLKLMDSVRKLIREELAEALMDPAFLNSINMAELAARLAYPLMQSPTFVGGLDGVLNNTVPRILSRPEVANAITVEVAKRLSVTPQGNYVTPNSSGISASYYHPTSSSAPIGPFKNGYVSGTTGNK